MAGTKKMTKKQEMATKRKRWRWEGGMSTTTPAGRDPARETTEAQARRLQNMSTTTAGGKQQAKHLVLWKKTVFKQISLEPVVRGMHTGLL